MQKDGATSETIQMEGKHLSVKNDRAARLKPASCSSHINTIQGSTVSGAAVKYNVTKTRTDRKQIIERAASVF